MDREKKIKLAKMSIVVLLVFSVSGYYLYRHSSDIGLTKPSLILKVSTDIDEKGDPVITNVTFEQSSVMFFYKRADTVPYFPEIQVNARINEMASAPASYWASEHFNYDNSTYTVKLFFRDGKEPKQGDVLILPIKIISYTGAIAYKNTAFWVWE